MSEFRDRYDTAAVAGGVSQPPFAELVRRCRRRAYRTRTVRLAGVAVVGALAATSLLALPSGTGPSSPAASSPPGPAPGTWQTRFLDLDHGVAYNTDQTTCTDSLFVTDDGGSTWSGPLAVPRFPDRERIEAQRYCLTPDVIPVAADTLVIPLDPVTEHEYVSARVQPPTISYISRDGGRTWQEYQPKTRVADVVPDGVIPEAYCEVQFQLGEYDSPRNDWCVGQPRLSWYDPETGDRMVLRNNPRLEELDTPDVGGDGSLWASGTDAAGEHHVVVSLDRGGTWRDVSPPLPAEVTGTVVAAADGDTAYVYWEYVYREAESALPANGIYQTTDGGETWQARTSEPPFAAPEGMWVTGDGSLLASVLPAVVPETDQVVYLSRDGGATFEEADVRVAPTEQIAGGFYGVRHDFVAQARVDAVSEDGLTWREFELPEFRLPE